MAGFPSGASSPVLSHVPVVTRTRREFGAAELDCGRLVTVMASRRTRECIGVQMTIKSDADTLLCGLLSPVAARQMARALVEAASAVEMAQRNPQFTRAEVRHV